MHVMIDEPEDDMDIQIATHIVKVHQRRERAFNVPYTMAQVQRYIRYARSIRPQINAQVGLFNKSQRAEAITAVHDTYVKSIIISISIRPAGSAWAGFACPGSQCTRLQSIVNIKSGLPNEQDI